MMTVIKDTTVLPTAQLICESATVAHSVYLLSYGLDDWGSIPGRGTGGSFPGGKAAEA
jgi:hypothetical protein